MTLKKLVDGVSRQLSSLSADMRKCIDDIKKMNATALEERLIAVEAAVSTQAEILEKCIIKQSSHIEPSMVDFPALSHSSDLSDRNSWAHITRATKEAATPKFCAAQQTRRSQDDRPVEQGEEDGGGGPFLPGSSQTHQQRLRNKRRRVRSREERVTG